MEEWKVNLLDTDNAMLVGDIGEAIALHYLSNHNFHTITRPTKFRLNDKWNIILISAHYQKQRMNYTYFLTDRQKEYLNEFSAWDYVAFKEECEPYLVVHEGKTHYRDWRNPYLVEVKTVRGERRPHKKPTSNSVSKAKELEFKPILVTVRLLENLDIFVEASEF